jgi:hypothetical protein
MRSWKLAIALTLFGLVFLGSASLAQSSGDLNAQVKLYEQALGDMPVLHEVISDLANLLDRLYTNNPEAIANERPQILEDLDDFTKGRGWELSRAEVKTIIRCLIADEGSVVEQLKSMLGGRDLGFDLEELIKDCLTPVSASPPELRIEIGKERTKKITLRNSWGFELSNLDLLKQYGTFDSSYSSENVDIRVFYDNDAGGIKMKLKGISPGNSFSYSFLEGNDGAIIKIIPYQIGIVAEPDSISLCEGKSFTIDLQKIGGTSPKWTLDEVKNLKVSFSNDQPDIQPTLVGNRVSFTASAKSGMEFISVLKQSGEVLCTIFVEVSRVDKVLLEPSTLRFCEGIPKKIAMYPLCEGDTLSWSGDFIEEFQIVASPGENREILPELIGNQAFFKLKGDEINSLTIYRGRDNLGEFPVEFKSMPVKPSNKRRNYSRWAAGIAWAVTGASWIDARFIKEGKRDDNGPESFQEYSDAWDRSTTLNVVSSIVSIWPLVEELLYRSADKEYRKQMEEWKMDCSQSKTNLNVTPAGNGISLAFSRSF